MVSRSTRTARSSSRNRQLGRRIPPKIISRCPTESVDPVGIRVNPTQYVESPGPSLRDEPPRHFGAADSVVTHHVDFRLAATGRPAEAPALPAFANSLSGRTCTRSSRIAAFANSHGSRTSSSTNGSLDLSRRASSSTVTSGRLCDGIRGRLSIEISPAPGYAQRGRPGSKTSRAAKIPVELAGRLRRS